MYLKLYKDNMYLPLLDQGKLLVQILDLSLLLKMGFTTWFFGKKINKEKLEIDLCMKEMGNIKGKDE